MGTVTRGHGVVLRPSAAKVAHSACFPARHHLRVRQVLVHGDVRPVVRHPHRGVREGVHIDGLLVFRAFRFPGLVGDYRFSPQLLPVTAFCVAFAALMVTPRRWMPSRWLQDVTLRMRVGIALTLCAPLAHAASLLFSESSYLLSSWGEWVEVLRVAVILFAVLASRWWAVEPPVSPYLRLRAALLPLLLFLVYIGTHPKNRDVTGLVWFYYLLVAIVVLGITFTFRRGQGRGVNLESKAE